MSRYRAAVRLIEVDFRECFDDVVTGLRIGIRKIGD